MRDELVEINGQRLHVTDTGGQGAVLLFALARLRPVVIRRTRMHTVTTPDDLKIFVKGWAQ
jgi:hypothetical protein